MNQRVLLFMIAFLKKGIIAYQEENKMSAYNLAVVFGPCFFTPRVYSLQDLIASGKFSSIILLFLNKFEEIIGEQEAKHYYNLL